MRRTSYQEHLHNSVQAYVNRTATTPCAECGMRVRDPRNHPYLACLAYKGLLRIQPDPVAAAEIIEKSLEAVQQRAVERHAEQQEAAHDAADPSTSCG